MAQEFVNYQDRVIPKAGFRAFVYGADNQQKLVDSWEEFECVIASGEWFSKKEEVPEKKIQDKGRK